LPRTPTPRTSSRSCATSWARQRLCQKITYKVTAANPRDLIQACNQYEPDRRIADMVATGTDIKPIEIVMFLRAVKSRVLFERRGAACASST
jgi:type I site-specific restriction endonuclease